MVSVELARTSVGIIENAIALILFLSPVRTFIQIVKKGAVEQFSPVSYLATFVNCEIWVLNGLPMAHPHSLLVITFNGGGLFIETVYLLLFLIYSARKQRIKVLLILLAEIVFVGVLSALVLTVAHTTKVRSNIVGSIAIVGNIMMNWKSKRSQLVKKKLVEERRSAKVSTPLMYLIIFFQRFQLSEGQMLVNQHYLIISLGKPSNRS